MIEPLPTASLMRRMAALIYDLFLLFAITLTYGGLLTIIKIIFNGTENLEAVQPGLAEQLLSMAGWIIALCGYYLICWRKQGQTLGMKAWRIRLQQADGSMASPEQCIQRCGLAPLSFLMLGIGYLWLLWPKASGCLHDILTQTQVVVTPKEKK